MENSAGRPPAGRFAVRALILVVALGIVALLVAAWQQPHLSDTEQIIGVLNDIRAGVAREDAGATMAHVGPDFQIMGLNRSQIRAELLNFYRQHTTVALTFTQPEIQIEGDTANLQVAVDLKMTDSPGSPPIAVFQGPITLELHRVRGRRYLIFPTSTWSIVKGSAPGAAELSPF
jgi:hypothetical protein